MKHMFDMSEKLITEQSDEIYGISTINWDLSSWEYLSLVGDEQVISLLHKEVYVFSDSVLYFGKMNENRQSNYAWGRQIDVVHRIDGEPMEFEWNIFPGFTTLQLCHKVQELLSRLSVTPENFTRRIFSCRCSTTSYGDLKTTKKNASQMLNSFLSVQKEIWSKTMVISRTWIREKWYSISADSPQGEWDRIAEKMMLTFAESKHPVFRATSPLSRGVLKSKGGGKLSIHCCADLDSM